MHTYQVNEKIEQFFFHESETGSYYLYFMNDGNIIDSDFCIVHVTDEFIDESEEMNIILGLFVSIGLGIGLLIITHEPIAFMGGSGMALFAFSSPALGSYQLLPAEIGYGLIVVLVLIGVIIWISN